MTVEARPLSVKVSPLTRFIYTALVAVQAGILITGGAVRLTGSGLGCPTWPRCTPGSYTPVPHQAQGTLHSWIEFGNRLLTILLFIAIIAAVIGVIRLRNRYSEKRALNWLALTQILGIIAQIILGGVTVLTHLNPATVGAHFLLSIVLIGASLSLRQRMLEKPRFALTATSTLLVRTVLALTAVVLVIGTVVTGTGPHAGDIQARRYHLNPQVISWIHADAVIALIALTFALILLLRATEDVAHRSLVVKQAVLFLLICLGQGLIGYIQYFTGLPEALVAAHLLGADLVWLGIWNLAFTGRSLSRS
jgi:cytochrome c oxidase assembly protein subunit 15